MSPHIVTVYGSEVVVFEIKPGSHWMRAYDYEGTVTGESLCTQKAYIKRQSQMWRGKLYFYKIGDWFEMEKDKDRSLKLRKLQKR